MITEREKYLMRAAMSEGDTYASIDEWLNTVIDDAGRTVEQHLEFDANQHSGMSKWISVDDKLPKDGKTVLVYSNFGEIFTCRKSVIVAKNAGGEFRRKIGVGKVKHEVFTHWQPLPSPPNTDK